jgi:3-oxoacyl-[acyl-carrier-protein] synthase III
MSSFLTQRTKFVPFVTFGDAAAAVVLSRVNDSVKYGLTNLVNLARSENAKLCRRGSQAQLIYGRQSD